MTGAVRPVLGGFGSLLRLFLPPQCPGCHSRVGQAGLCRECATEIDESLSQPIAFAAGELPGIAAGPYAGRWREVVLAYKKDPIRSVTAIVHDRLWGALGPVRAGVPRVVVPVPMAAVRRRERGWNPAEVLALELGARARWPVATGLLERVRYRGTLARSGREERERLLTGAIRLREGWEGLLPGDDADTPTGAVLVDDVVTTGATLSACQDALFEAGFYDVLCLTLARTP